ncbi:hypothetical protein FRC11_011733, partial [Ceratobasidium sp. 423]
MSAEAIFDDVLKEMYPETDPKEIRKQIRDDTLSRDDKEKMIGLFLEKTAKKLDSGYSSRFAQLSGYLPATFPQTGNPKSPSAISLKSLIRK